MSLTQRVQMQELRPYPFILFVKLRGKLRRSTSISCVSSA